MKGQLLVAQPLAVDVQLNGSKPSNRKGHLDVKYRAELQRLEREKKEAKEVCVSLSLSVLSM